MAGENQNAVACAVRGCGCRVSADRVNTMCTLDQTCTGCAVRTGGTGRNSRV